MDTGTIVGLLIGLAVGMIIGRLLTPREPVRFVHVDPADLSEPDPVIEELLRAGKKIHAIKRHRDRYGSDLKAAKDAIDLMEARMRQSGAGLDPDVEALLLAGRKIQAIKRYRELHGTDLEAAKEDVERIEARMRQSGALP